MSADKLSDLIRGERQAMVPPRAAQEATWAKVASSVRTPGSVLPGDAGATSAAASATPWTKILLVFALGGGGVAYATADDAVTPPSATKTTTQTAENLPLAAPLAKDASVPSPAVPRAVSPEALPAVVPPQVVPSGAGIASVAARLSTESKSQTKVAVPADAALSAASALGEEARLLGAAGRALRAADHDAALRHLAAHAQRFPQGQLAEDSLALRARTLCDRGDRAQGAAAATKLAQAFPDSKHLARVGRVCASNPP